MDRPLGDDDLGAYRRDGFVVLGRILDDDQIAALLDAERRLRTTDVFALDGRQSGLLVTEQRCAESAPLRTVLHRGCAPRRRGAGPRPRRRLHAHAVHHQAPRTDRCLARPRGDRDHRSIDRQLDPPAPGRRLRPARTAARRDGVDRAHRHRRVQRLPRRGPRFAPRRPGGARLGRHQRGPPRGTDVGARHDGAAGGRRGGALHRPDAPRLGPEPIRRATGRDARPLLPPVRADGDPPRQAGARRSPFVDGPRRSAGSPLSDPARPDPDPDPGAG